MNPSDVVHKTVFKAGGSRNPSAKAHNGTQQKRNALGTLHSKSRCGPHVLNACLAIFKDKYYLLAIPRLHWRTFNRSVGTEHATVAALRFQNGFAIRALIEKLAGVGRHYFRRGE